MAKVLEFQLQHQSFQWDSELISLRIVWFDLLTVQGTLKSLLKPHPCENFYPWVWVGKNMLWSLRPMTCFYAIESDTHSAWDIVLAIMLYYLVKVETRSMRSWLWVNQRGEYPEWPWYGQVRLILEDIDIPWRQRIPVAGTLLISLAGFQKTRCHEFYSCKESNSAHILRML